MVNYPVGLLSNVAWMAQAKCIDEDHRLFLSYDIENINQAKKICMDCTVKFECMDQYFDVSCVAGGLSYLERLMHIWKKVENIDESNWRNPNYLLRQYRRK